MKIIYSQLKTLLPGLKATPLQLRDDLTLIGHFVSGYQDISGEQVLDLEIRQNRGDALSYYGLARDLSVYYNIPLVLPLVSLPNHVSTDPLPVQIDTSDVLRVMAVRISGIKVNTSPDWLKQFLELHGVNSINNIVDLTNYVMFLYGIPNHAFDTAKTTPNLIWKNISQPTSFTTLDGTSLQLTSPNLVIANPEKPLSLSFIGGQNSGISRQTTETIIEVAIYNRSRVRSDSRALKTVTEASIRLDKYLDTQIVPLAFRALVNLIQQYAGGKLTSQVFDHYPAVPVINTITFDPRKPASYAGIEISPEFAIDCLDRLGCTIQKAGDSDYLVTPPSLRKDITLEEDLIEEVIRFHGYDKIPLDQPISSQPHKDITPPVLYLAENIKNELVRLGYDEIRSWPLIKKSSLLTEFLEPGSSPIYTQNSINSEYPVLRTSIISSLIDQKAQFDRYKLPNHQYFEFGKIFQYTPDHKIKEEYSLAAYHPDPTQLTQDISTVFNHLNLGTPRFYTKYNHHGLYYELYLEPLLNHYSGQPANNLPENQAYELTHQVITLDANVTYETKQNPVSLLTHYRDMIDQRYLWQIVITDEYHDPNSGHYRYTFRVSYFNTDDKTAKQIHLKTFGLAS